MRTITTDQVPPPNARTLLSSANIYLIAMVLLSLLLLGTFRDYAISTALYTPGSKFAIFFAAYGEYPVFLAMSASGTLFLMGHNRQVRWVGYLEIGGGSALLAVAVGAGTLFPADYIEWSISVRGIIAVVLVSAAAYVTYLVGRNGSRETMIKVAIALVAVVAIELVVVTALKLVWERPRMRMITAVGDGTWFVPWYLPGFAEKEALMSLGIPSEEFKSFPSGHSSNAAVAMTMSAFAAFPVLRDRAALLLYAGFAYALVVAFSRIVAGAHYVSDVAAGMLITFVAMAVVYQLVFPPRQPKHSGRVSHKKVG